MHGSMNYLLAACGLGIALVGACLAADLWGFSTWLRKYTFSHASRGPGILRGTYDAPVFAYRLLGVFFVVLGVLLVVGAITRSG